MTTMTEKRSDEVTPQAMTDDDDAALIAELLESTITAADAPNVPRAARLELLNTIAKLGDWDADAREFAERVLWVAEYRGVAVPLRWLYGHRDLLSRLHRELSDGLNRPVPTGGLVSVASAYSLRLGWELTAAAAHHGMSLSFENVLVMQELTWLRRIPMYGLDRAANRERLLNLFVQYRRLADVGVPRLAAYVELTPPRGRGMVSAKTVAEWRDLLTDGLPAELVLSLRGYTDADVARVRDLLNSTLNI